MSRFSQYAGALKDALEARMTTVEGGPMDGVLVLTNRDVQEAIASVEVPPPDEHHAELATPATVMLTALCHVCGEFGVVPVGLESKTTVDDKRRVLAAKVDAGSIVHTCGQIAAFGPRNVTPEVAGQEEMWTIPLADDASPIAPDELVTMLGRLDVEVTDETVAEWTDEERRLARSWAVLYHIWQSHPGETEPIRPDFVPAPPVFAGPCPATKGERVCLHAEGHKGRHKWGPAHPAEGAPDPGTHSADGDPEGAGDPGDDLLPES